LIQKNNFINSAQAFVKEQMIFPNTQVLSHNEYIKLGVRHIDVTLIGESLPKDSLQVAMITKLDSIGLGGTVLNSLEGESQWENDEGPEVPRHLCTDS
jgi:hypothetical protein